jgi:hypothetical protein
MSPEANLPEEEEERNWGDRAARVAGAARALGATRLAILREELDAKAGLFAKGLGAVAAAAALGVGVLLLFAALLSAVLSQLFHNVALGILATMLIYAAGATVAGRIGWKALARVQPTEFPATGRELARDFDTISAALAPEPEPEDEPPPQDPPPDEGEVEDLEARLRAGAE